MDRKLTYKKEPGERELEVEFAYSKVSPQGTLPMYDTSLQIPSVYKKEDGVLSYSLICVISGGTDRERIFLNELERKRTFKNVEVSFISSKKGGGGLTPKMMLSKYKKLCNDGHVKMQGRFVELDDLDKIYMFTDVDHYKEELKEILAGEKSDMPKWIISNPDFEIWIYYCYRNSPHEDFKAVVEEKESQRSSKLKTVNGTFNNGGGLDTRKAFEHLEDGIAHSKEHYQETNGIPNLLSTQMHVFAEDVLVRLGNEYEEFVLKKQELRDRMRTRIKRNA